MGFSLYCMTLFLQSYSFTVWILLSRRVLLFLPISSRFSILCFLQSNLPFLKTSTWDLCSQSPLLFSISPCQPQPMPQPFSSLWKKTASGSWEFLEDLSQTIPSTRKLRKARKQLMRLNHELTKGSTEKADQVSVRWGQKYHLARADGDKHNKASTTDKT